MVSETYHTDRAELSAKIFDDITTPILEWYFDGQVKSTEKHDGTIETWLDKDCGVDAIVRTNSKIVFGIAHRINKKYYRTFTIHMSRPDEYITEIDHLRQPGFKPRYHVQTACKDGKPVEIAIAKTNDLLYAIDNGLAKIKTSDDGQEFAVLYWDKLIENGINVDIIYL